MDLATVDHLLTTTRSVRKRLDLDRPVPLDVIETCLELAMQAPTASNLQHWDFVVVTDPAHRKAIADAYMRSFSEYARVNSDSPQLSESNPFLDQQKRVVDSAIYLASHLHRVPVHVLACLKGRYEQATPDVQAAMWGSILPAAWSFMLALRSRGLGTAWTTLHIKYEREVGQMLGIPDDVTQACLFPVAYYTGDDFKPARRLPARQAIHFETWGQHEPR